MASVCTSAGIPVFPESYVSGQAPQSRARGGLGPGVTNLEQEPACLGKQTELNPWGGMQCFNCNKNEPA